MLPTTISAIAIQNSMNIRKNRLCIDQGQRISGAADVLYFRMRACFESQFAAQVADVGIDAAIVGNELAAQRLFGKLIARNHGTRGTHQQLQHADLRARQRHRFAGNAYLVHAGIRHDRSDLEYVRCRGARIAVADAAQYGANARHQLARIERLAEVIVGAQFETDDAIDIVAASGQHQDRRGARRAEFAQHVEAADARQHDVEYEDFELVGAQLFERDAAVVHALDLEVFGVQIFG